uniref:Uncharacterized protein n=1 Tax=Anopheles culicifacies TaxID=139723 RepID=A0A182LWJ2_9DIPT
MTSRSTQFRKRRRILEEAEREFEAEYNQMEASGSFCPTRLTGLNFAKATMIDAIAQFTTAKTFRPFRYARWTSHARTICYPRNTTTWYATPDGNSDVLKKHPTKTILRKHIQRQRIIQQLFQQKDPKSATISAKPKIRNLCADVIRFVPSALRAEKDEVHDFDNSPLNSSGAGLENRSSVDVDDNNCGEVSHH